MALPPSDGQHHNVRIHKFDSTTTFIAIDLASTDVSSGPVRWARKVLQGGAKDLARSQTYTYAVLGMSRGGASAGISAEAPDREETVAGFVDEAGALVADGTFLPDPGKGVRESDLTSLRDADPRDTARFLGDGAGFVGHCEALSAVVCAESTLGGLDGRTVAIEGSGGNVADLVALASARGAKIIVGPTDDGKPADIASVVGSEADVVFVGSKMGVVDHVVAESLAGVEAVVPWGRLPLTAKALAVLRRSGVAAPADFVALAGSSIALWGDHDRTDADIEAAIAEQVGAMSAEFAAHDDGPMLAACYRAEDYLATWQEALPFGRPLAP